MIVALGKLGDVASTIVEILNRRMTAGGTADPCPRPGLIGYVVSTQRWGYQVGCADTPPSTTRLTPVIHSAIDEARNTQALPTSAGRPSRPSGTAF